jgi:hypothetical protein
MKAEGWESAWSDEDEPEGCDVCCAAGLDDVAGAEEFWAIELRLCAKLLAGTPLCAIWGAKETVAERIVTAEQKAAQAPLWIFRIFKRIGMGRGCWAFDSQPRSSGI